MGCEFNGWYDLIFTSEIGHARTVRCYLWSITELRRWDEGRKRKELAMGISALTVRLLLLFAPGIIWSFMLNLYTIHRERSRFFFSLQSLIFGLSCHLVLWFVSLCVPYFTVSLFHALLNEDIEIRAEEIFLSCVIAIGAGTAHCYIYNKKLVNILFRKAGITKKYGDESVWSYFLNTDNDPWVYVRDLEHDLCYQGYIDSYSDENNKHELLLYNVAVHNNSTGEKLYSLQKLYLPLKDDCFSLEFPVITEESERKNEPRTKEDHSNHQ